MQRNDELMHYGVLGMKWGQRRARKLAKKADLYSSRSKYIRSDIARAKKNPATANNPAIGANEKLANKYSQKAAKARAKSKNIEQYHTKMAGGKKAYDYTKNQSTGKAIAKSMLLSTYGAHKYNQARSQGDSRLKAGAKGIGYANANALTYGAASVIEPRVNKKRKK